MRVRLQRLHPKSKVLAGGEAMVVPLPTADGQVLADAELITWTETLIDQLWPVAPPVSEVAPAS
jgi:transcription-repair coupling factor (superfamily II helicase)